MDSDARKQIAVACVARAHNASKSRVKRAIARGRRGASMGWKDRELSNSYDAVMLAVKFALIQSYGIPDGK